MPTASSPEHDVFHSRFNRVMAVVIWAVVALVAISLFLVPAGPHLFYLVPDALIALFAWEVLWVPVIEIDDQGVVLKNPLRSISVPWAALVHVDTKYALTLYTPGHKYAAWAAPAPGRGETFRANKSDRSLGRGSAPLVDGGARPGDLLGTESGEAAQLVRSRWQQLRDEDRIEAGVAHEALVRVTWHRAVGVGMAVLAAASVAAILFA